MARKSITDAETRHAFLQYLSDEGFPVGVGETMKIERLVCGRRGALTAEQWKYVIAPVLARDGGEQQRFYDAYDIVFDTKLAQKDRAAMEVNAGLGTPPNAGQRPRRTVATRSLWAVAAIVPVLVLYLYSGPSVVSIIDSLPSRPTQAVPALDASVSPGQQVETITVDAPCGGMRCFTTPLAWLLAMPVLLWLVSSVAFSAGVGRSLRTHVRESRRWPPFVWPLHGRASLLSLGRLGTVVRMLRKRDTGDVFDFDVGESIHATVRAAGFPAVRFLRRSRESEYLFLVEEIAKHDHFAAWVRAIVERLQQGAVQAHVYSYRGDPRLCRPMRGQPVTLRRLASDCGGSRLVIAGGASAIVNPLSGEPCSWTTTVRAEWPQSVLLTPGASVDYGQAERVAARVMTVREFTLTNLSKLPDLFDPPLRAGLPAFERVDYPLPPGDLFANPADGKERLLAAFFPPPVFRWLCACAVHTHLEWEWTLALGALVASDEGSLTSRHSLLLVRLPWFRAGVIPGTWRVLLVRSLDPALAAAVRHALVRHIEAHAAPPATYAADKQRLDLAAHRYWLEPNAERRVTLERAIESVAPSDVQSDAILVDQQQAWAAQQSPSADETWTLLLWARFRGRAGLVKSALAVAATISVGVWLWSRSIETTLTRPVTPPPAPAAVTKNPDPAPTPGPSSSGVPAPAATNTLPANASRPPAEPTTTPSPSVDPDPGRVAVASPPPAFAPPSALVPMEALPSWLFVVPATQRTDLSVPVAESRAPEPAADQTFPVSGVTGKNRLLIAFRTAAGYPLPNPADIELRDTRSPRGSGISSGVPGGSVRLDLPNVRFDANASGSIALTGLPDGTYTLKVDPSGIAAQSRTITVSGGRAEFATFAADIMIAPEEVAGVLWPRFESLPNPLRELLSASNGVQGLEGLSGTELYSRLDDLQAAALLNLFAKADKVQAGPEPVSSFFKTIVQVRGDRMFVVIDPRLRDYVERDSRVFGAVPSALHSPPPGYAAAGWFKTREDARGVLQLTFFSSASRQPEMMVDLDIDESAGLGNVFNVIKRLE